MLMPWASNTLSLQEAAVMWHEADLANYLVRWHTNPF